MFQKSWERSQSQQCPLSRKICPRTYETDFRLRFLQGKLWFANSEAVPIHATSPFLTTTALEKREWPVCVEQDNFASFFLLPRRPRPFWSKWVKQKPRIMDSRSPLTCSSGNFSCQSPSLTRVICRQNEVTVSGISSLVASPSLSLSLPQCLKIQVYSA